MTEFFVFIVKLNDNSSNANEIFFCAAFISDVSLYQIWLPAYMFQLPHKARRSHVRGAQNVNNS